ncbi:hypothetical protein SDC9_129462 [bioreactor metagenome]|uniref:Endo-polygalacturonase n=1 Tax=bioreactor metagenome TaxID=1076179 RepID=A0A645CZV4_9ZZZZ
MENADLGNGDAKDNKQLIDLAIAGSGWSTTKERGTIRDIMFRNITVLNGLPNQEIRIAGFDETHGIDGVTIENLSIYSKPVLSLDDLSPEVQFAQDIAVRWTK